MLSMVLLSTPIAASAQSAPAAPPEDRDAIVLDNVLVTGTQPGPRMWRISKGDHTLWVLGTLRPLPTQMAWASQEVDEVIARSGEVLAPGYAKAKLGVGDMFKAATLIPSAMKSIKNPDGAELKDVLPADLYARWLPLKLRYIGKSNKDNDRRPAIAAIELYGWAIKTVGLSNADIVWTTIAESAKRHGVKVTETGFTFPIDIDRKRLKAGIKTYSQARPELACFTESLDQLEPDLATMKLRANAWARGDLDVLRAMSSDDLQPPCLKPEQEAAAFMQMPEIKLKLETTWLAAARSALEHNQTSFASLPIEQILQPDGYLARLRSLGYTVHEPDEMDPKDEDSDD
jgi:hypothetical protein